jgi:glycosyltransferase 2 family protein
MVLEEEGELPLKQPSVKLLLKVAFTALLLAVIVWQLGGLAEVGTLMRGINPWYVVVLLLFNTADRALMTFKWAWLLRCRGVHLPFLRGMRIYCASMIWGMFLPATMGADVIRAVKTSAIGLNSHEIVASIVIERMLGFLASLLCGLVGLVLLSFFSGVDGRFDFLWWLGGAALLGTVILFAASFTQRVYDFLHHHLLYRFRHQKIMEKFRQFHSTYRAYREHKRSLATFFGLTLIEQLGPMLHSWLVAQSLGIDVGLPFIAGAVPLALLISRIPISIGGYGVYDGVFILLMSLAGVHATEAISISLVGRLMETGAWLPWWLTDVVGNRSLRLARPFAERTEERVAS